MANSRQIAKHLVTAIITVQTGAGFNTMSKATKHTVVGTGVTNPHRLLSTIFLAAAVLVVASILVTYWVGLVTVQSEERMAHQLQTLQLLSNTGSTLKDTETGQRGYLLTGDDHYLEPYNTALSQLQSYLDQLQKLTAAGELQSNSVERVISLSKEKLAELDRTIRLRRTGGLQATLPVVRDGRGKQLMDQLRSELGDLQTHAQVEFDKSARRAAWTGALRTVVFAIFGVLNVAFLAWAYRRVSSETRQREAAARESRENRKLLQAIINNSITVVYVKDVAGRYLLVNRRFEELFKVTSASFVGKTDYDLFTKEQADAFRAVDQQVTTSGQVAPRSRCIPMALEPLKKRAASPRAFPGRMHH